MSFMVWSLCGSTMIGIGKTLGEALLVDSSRGSTRMSFRCRESTSVICGKIELHPCHSSLVPVL